MSSSNREARPADGLVVRNESPVGPLRLPRKQVQSFIEEFNRVYDSLGLRLEEMDVAAADRDEDPVDQAKE